MIPSTALADLSDAAQALYRKGARDFHRQVTIETSNADALAAATEIAEAGYGTLHITEGYGSTLRVTPHAKGFSVARRDTLDDGDFAQTLVYIEVEVLRNAHDRDGFLLACLYGATVTNRTTQRSPWAGWTAEVRHGTARDSDHSAAILASINIDHPVLDNVDGYSTSLVGTLTEARMWPTGTDVTLLDSHDATPIAEPAICTDGPCARSPHPWAPFEPAARDDLDTHRGRPVRITTTPLVMVDEHGRHFARPAVTRADY